MDAYQAELEAFIQMLVDDSEPEVTGLDGRMPVVIGSGCLEVVSRRPAGEAQRNRRWLK